MAWKVECEILGLNLRTALNTPMLEEVEESGIHGVAVKCVDIVRKTSGEGESLDSY